MNPSSSRFGPSKPPPNPGRPGDSESGLGPRRERSSNPKQQSSPALRPSGLRSGSKGAGRARLAVRPAVEEGGDGRCVPSGALAAAPPASIAKPASRKPPPVLPTALNSGAALDSPPQPSEGDCEPASPPSPAPGLHSCQSSAPPPRRCPCLGLFAPPRVSPNFDLCGGLEREVRQFEGAAKRRVTSRGGEGRQAGARDAQCPLRPRSGLEAARGKPAERPPPGFLRAGKPCGGAGGTAGSRSPEGAPGGRPPGPLGQTKEPRSRPAEPPTPASAAQASRPGALDAPPPCLAAPRGPPASFRAISQSQASGAGGRQGTRHAAGSPGRRGPLTKASRAGLLSLSRGGSNGQAASPRAQGPRLPGKEGRPRPRRLSSRL